MNKKMILLIISITSLLCIVCSAYVFSVNYTNTVKFLGEEITTEEYSEVFVKNVAEKYLEDKVIKLNYENVKTEILATDFCSVDVLKTAELTNRNILFNNNIKPIMNIDKAKLTVLLKAIINEHQDFYSVSEKNEFVSINLNNGVPDIISAALKITDNVNKLDFSSVDIDNYEIFDAEEISYLINREPLNAQCIYDGDVQTDILNEQVGITISTQQLSQYINWGLTEFNVDIIKKEYPEITKEILIKKAMFGDVLAELSSRYSTSAWGRSVNVELASKKINGIILKPGEVFSYNRAVGPRTYENGFKDAGVYTSNGLESGVGGGICQVSSTLYGTQLMADLKTVTRTNHSYTIGYLPSGQDATVSYGSIDYKFINNKDFPIKIESIASGGLLTIKILGFKTSDYREIKLVNEVLSSTPPETVEKIVDDLEPGQQRVAQAGQNGMAVNTYKVYYKDGIKEKTEFVHKSTYIPMNRIVEISADNIDEEEINQDTVQEVEVEDEMFEEPVPSENGGLDDSVEATFNQEIEDESLIINQNIDENEQIIVEN